jgi:hypothetical protein
MNERITLLALKASNPKTGWLDRQKFAELIVQDCARVYWNIDQSETHTEYVNDLKKHFGVE